MLPEEPFVQHGRGASGGLGRGVAPRRGEADRKLRQPHPHSARRHPRQWPARTGLTEAMREFCEFRNLLPRGLRLAPEDVWEGCSYVLSVKLEDPQFPGRPRNAWPRVSAPHLSPEWCRMR